MNKILPATAHQLPINRSTKKAFTLVEVIVVLAIVGIIFGMSFPFFSSFSKASKLRSAATTISTVLRTARTYAVTKRKNYLVIINEKETANLYYAVKIYQEDDGTVDRWYKLPQGIEIDEIAGFDETDAMASVPFPSDSDPAESKPAVEFKPTGGAKYSGSIYIKDNEDNYKRIIVINTTGRVRITDEGPEG